MIIDHRDHITFLRPTLNYIAMPFDYLVHAPLSWIGGLWTSLQSREQLVSENEVLKQERLVLRARLQRFEFLQQENAELRSLLSSTNQLSGRVLAASLISAALEPFHQTVLLDKGRDQGIYLNQPVLDAHGVMGQITAVYKNTAKLMLITDSRCGIPVQNLRSGDRAILVGGGAGGLLELIHMPHTSDVAVGDVWVTSGLDRHYPIGYPVGKVMQVKHESGKNFATILVAPIAKLNQSRQVILLWTDEVSSKE